jgi:hypothetical protein
MDQQAEFRQQRPDPVRVEPHAGVVQQPIQFGHPWFGFVIRHLRHPGFHRREAWPRKAPE